jgi:hypothetical protein
MSKSSSLTAAGRHRSQPDVVAVQAGVDRADGDRRLDPGDLGSEGSSQPHTALLDADEDHAVEASVALDDLVGHPGDGSSYVVGPEDPLVGRHVAPPCGPHRTRFTVRPKVAATTVAGCMIS